MTLLIVTPIHNEIRNITNLAEQLDASTLKPTLWVVVDDGSTDGGAEALESHASTFQRMIVSRQHGGGLINGSAFGAWQFGVDAALRESPTYDLVMKLDADVDLPPGYLAASAAELTDLRVGLAGGVLVGKGRHEQTLHVPGPVKMYSRAGYEALVHLPRHVGFDVMDELQIKQSGLAVSVVKTLGFRVRRDIGASQGLVHGRYRNGRVCRWTGYWLPYFLLHAIRYCARRPYVVGSLAMIIGFVRASPGPYDKRLRDLHRIEQQGKLKAALRSPVKWLRATYIYAEGTD